MDSRQRNAWGEMPSVVQNHSIDSMRWRHVSPQHGDVIICSWAKSGTTWLQQVVAQMLHGIGGLHVLPRVAPWVDSPYVPIARLDGTGTAGTSRPRIFKSHLPAPALPYSSAAKYIYAARDGRDAIWSWYQHHRQLRPIVYQAMQGRLHPPLPPPNADFRAYFNEWLDRDGYPLWPYWSHVKSWWELRSRPNVFHFHFNRIQADANRLIRELGAFLELDLSGEEVHHIQTYSSKDYMARYASMISPDLALALRGGGESFFSGRRHGWRDLLSAEDVARHEQTAHRELGDEIAAWLSSCGPHE